MKLRMELISQRVELVSVVIFGMLGLGILWLLVLNIWGCIPMGLSLIGLALCLKKIPAEPPHLGLITKWGERQPSIKKEGWRFLTPFFPFFYDVILVNVEKKNQDLPAEIVRTPDLAELIIPISLTWTPGAVEKERTGQYLINYLNSGGETGVRDILADVVRERVREWAISHIEGPKDFQEALGAQEDAVEILVKAIAGEELGKIPSKLPTTILFHYFTEPQRAPIGKEAEQWGENWDKLKTRIKNPEPDEGSEEEVKKAIKIRKETMQKIKTGNGAQSIPQLGITLNRLNIGDIKIKPGTQLEKTAELKIAEKRQRDAEIVELEHVKKRIDELMDNGKGHSREKATDIVQTERGKITKKINEIQGIDLEGFGRGLGKSLGKFLEK